MGSSGRRFVTTMLTITLVAGLGLFKPRPAVQPAGALAGDPPRELTLGLPAEPQSLDSTFTASQAAFTILGNVMEGLVRLGPDGTPEPGVAASWEVSDGVEYTFHLREEARWSDGRPVTSHDFKYAWLRVLDPTRAVTYAYQLYYIRGAQEYNTLRPDAPGFAQAAEEARAKVAIETPDDRTLKVTLVEPTPQWLALTAFPIYYPVREDVAEAHGERYGREPEAMVYNGPFVVAEWTPGEGLVLAPNPAYWDADQVRLERVTFRTVPDGLQAARLYEAGVLDRTVIPGQLAASYGQDGEVIPLVQPVTWYLVLNQRQGKLQDPDLRRAVSLAVDRRELVRRLGGDAEPAAGLVPPVIAAGPGQRFRQLAGPVLSSTRSLEQAREHWQAALDRAESSTVTLTLLIGDSPLNQQNGQALQEMLQEALPGLTVELETVPFSTLLERTRQGEYELALTLTGAEYDDPLTFLSNWTTASPFNDAQWINLDYDSLVRRARAAGEDPSRYEALAEAERLLLSEAAVIPLYHPVTTVIQKPWVRGVVDRPLGADLDLKGAWVEITAPAP
ncbi:MAG TPA: peptide ABC transporter substrate-binding protein [Symbiobacteriaceae bacterium]